MYIELQKEKHSHACSLVIALSAAPHVFQSGNPTYHLRVPHTHRRDVQYISTSSPDQTEEGGVQIHIGFYICISCMRVFYVLMQKQGTITGNHTRWNTMLRSRLLEFQIQLFSGQVKCSITPQVLEYKVGPPPVSKWLFVNYCFFYVRFSIFVSYVLRQIPLRFDTTTVLFLEKLWLYIKCCMIETIIPNVITLSLSVFEITDFHCRVQSQRKVRIPNQ